MRPLDWAIYIRNNKRHQKEIEVYRGVTLYEIRNYYRCRILPTPFNTVTSLKRAITLKLGE